MRNKKPAHQKQGIRELCRWCNTIAEVDVHLLIPAEERKIKIY